MNKKMLKEMISVYGKENIPNPNQYPLQFEFLVKSFEHRKRMQSMKKASTEVSVDVKG